MSVSNPGYEDERNKMLQWMSARSPMIPTSDLEFLIGGLPSFEPEDDGEDEWGEIIWP